MRPKDSKRMIVDPRAILRSGGKAALETLLRSVGYVPQPQMLNDLALALRRFRPLLLGGKRGTGKTAIAEDLALACNLYLYSIPGHEALDARDVMGGWDRAEQESMARQAIFGGMSLSEAQAQKWRRAFYEPGEFLQAYEEASRAAECGEPPPLLLIDEVEKLLLNLQHTLLQPLARGFADVPKLEGTIGVERPEHRPIVILTSNDLSRLSEPLTSRCFVTWLRSPTPAEEVSILRARVPNASLEMVASVTSMIQFIREEMPEIRNEPGIRESVDLLSALVDDGVIEITIDVIREYLACLAKGKNELEVLAQNDDGLAWAAKHPPIEIRSWLYETQVSSVAEFQSDQLSEVRA
jgi:MoxR-like ATPase